jgi:hypothetical protein
MPSVLAMHAHQAIHEKNSCKKNQYKKAVPVYHVKRLDTSIPVPVYPYK